VYENKNNDKGNNSFVDISLKGPEKNINAIGAKIIEFSGEQIRTYENYPVRGFQSSMQVPIHIGLERTKIDSMFLIWPDNSCQPVLLNGKDHINFTYTKGLPLFDYSKITSFRSNRTRPMENITSSTNLNYIHTENPFIEFNREPLIPHMLSTEGPALAVADVNHDGLEDVFIGSSKTFHDAIYLQQSNGKFIKTEQPAMALDSMYEDVDATWIDVNNDGNTDLVIASGGNEYYGEDEHLLPRVYLNDGNAHFAKKADAFSNLYYTFSCVVPYDFNGDGFVDLFLGGRDVPWEYGQIPHSYLLQNDGTGKFTDVTDKYAKELSQVGMVTQAVWYDIDKDGDKDLVVCCEWGGINVFINDKGKFKKQVITDKQGWWNFVLPIDIDNDGDVDLVAGNLGLNTRLKATTEQPVRLYYNDFDDNGKKEQVLSYYVHGKELPFANKDELQKQIPAIKKSFLYAEDFAKASMDEIFTGKKLADAQILTANYFANAVLINDGKMHFKIQSLPWEAQLSSYRDAVTINANADDLHDILLVGNYYDNNIQMGRYDADFGTILVNKGHGNFGCETINRLVIKGQVRHIKQIMLEKNKEAFILARNNDSVVVIRNKF